MKWALLLFLFAQQNITIEVGHSKDLHLGFKPGMTICDDTTVVQVEDAGEALRLTGLKEGQTDCAFRKIAELPAILVHITVIPPPGKRKK